MTVFDNTSKFQAVLEKLSTQPAIHEVTDYTARYLEGTLTYLSDNIALKVQDQAFHSTPLKSLTLEACQEIGISAFAGCSKLRNVSLPSCISIDENAFIDCTALSKVYLPGSTVCNLKHSNAFLGFTGKFYVPSELLSEYKIADNWSYYSSCFSAI